MLSILFLILKIIGIILLSILGLILLLILVILFAPIHYRAKAEYYGKPGVDVRINWLMHLLRSRIMFQDGQLHIRIKFFMFTLYNNECEKEEKDHKTADKKHRKEKSVFDEEDGNDVLNDSDISTSSGTLKQPEVHALSVEEETESTKNTESAKSIESAGNTETPDNLLLESEEHVKAPSFLERLKEKLLEFWIKICGFVRTCISLVQDVVHKAEHAKENCMEKLQQIRDFFNDADNKALFAFVKEQLRCLIQIIKPKKYEVNLHFGFKDSEITGKALTWIAIAYGFLGMDLNIQPDFEKQIFEGHIFLKGYIQLYRLIIIAVKCYRNKQIRKFINK